MTEIHYGEFRFIATQAALEALCAQLHAVPWLGLDTEFERSRTFYAELCLVQIAAPGVLACIDPFAVESLAPLMDVLASAGSPKYLHAARQDLEVLHQVDGRLPVDLLDTQVAAGLAGFADNIGYADLVQQLLGVSLDKSQTRTDWRQRPLTTAQLDYAAADVLHLGPIAQMLEARLAELGRSAWLAQDSRALLGVEQYRQAPELAWQRLRGLANLPPVAQARAVALAAWRESTAQSRNLPRGWVLKDDELMSLATNVPASARELAAQLASNGNVRRHAETIIELLNACPMTAPGPASKRLTVAGRAHLKRLSACAQDIAQQLGIAASILVTRRELEMLVWDETPARLRDGWRGAQLGALLALHAETRVDGLWEA
ncbi:MAG: ribonuclease D [Gammaproteobacteria bacterium]|nr:ribonuclease D [Gammaproteobacteria bacterium]